MKDNLDKEIDALEFEGAELCTYDQWKSFFAHPCWKEFLDTMKTRLAITRTELEQIEDCRKLQGEAAQLRFVLAFEELIGSEQEQKLKEKEKQDERSS